jgi:hypothetical protein
MVKTKGSRVVVEENSIKVILTDELMEGFRNGATISISNDGEATRVELLMRSSICAVMSKSAGENRVESPQPARVGGTVLPSEPPPLPVVSSIRSEKLPVTAASSTQRKSSPVTAKTPSPLRGSAENPVSSKGVSATKPARAGKSSARKKSPVRGAEAPKKKPVLDPLAKVESRLRKMGRWVEGVPVKDQLESLDEDLKTSILSQSYLWKSYAISNRLPGYESAVENRSVAVSNDPNHVPSKHQKIQARLLAGSNAGQCLRQASAPVLTNLAQAPEETATPSEIQTVSQSSIAEARQMGEALGNESALMSDSADARLPSSQKGKV